MNVLFICSGNSKDGINAIVKEQGTSLKGMNVNIKYFPILGKGFSGYSKHIMKLKHHIHQYSYDIYHAHYSLSAFVGTLSGCHPLVVSLMGSDAHSQLLLRPLIRYLSINKWQATIVKSRKMKSSIGIANAYVMPNGVDVKKFFIVDQKKAKKFVKFDLNKKYVLFASDPQRKEKNFSLAEKAFNKLNLHNVDLKIIYNKPLELMPYYYNACDVLLLTSLWEGSPNVIKEAMACNCPIVASDVGDVRWVLGKTEGCYIASLRVKDMTEKIDTALKLKKRTQGRERILELGLDSDSTANKIIKIYKSLST